MASEFDELQQGALGSFILKRSSVLGLGRKSSIFKHGLKAEKVLDVRMQ